MSTTDPANTPPTAVPGVPVEAGGLSRALAVEATSHREVDASATDTFGNEDERVGCECGGLEWNANDDPDKIDAAFATHVQAALDVVLATALPSLREVIAAEVLGPVTPARAGEMDAAVERGLATHDWSMFTTEDDDGLIEAVSDAITTALSVPVQAAEEVGGE